MRNRRLLLPALLAVLVPSLLHSQAPALTPERQAAMMEAGRLISTPAEFVLHHRQALALTGEQVASLEHLAAALRDSSAVRMALHVRVAQQNATAPGLTTALSWTGPIDDAAIRETFRAQSALQAEIMIAGARDRRAVAALLTPEQREQLPDLQMAEMLKAARGGS